jgi:hypothetical protein
MADRQLTPKNTRRFIGRMTRTTLLPRLRSAAHEPALIFWGLLLAGIIEVLWTIPTFSIETNRDWFIWVASGRRVVAGLSPYGAFGYLYPPAMAVLWAAGMSPTVWLFLKMVALVALIPALGIRFGTAVALVVMVQTPLDYDLLMGNVTTFYVAAAIWFGRRSGWGGAAPLGLLLALALKPAFVPLLIVTARWQSRDVTRVAIVFLAATALTIPVTGLSAFYDYARTLATWAESSAAWVGGNLGPGRYGFALPALILGLSTLLVALLCRDRHRAAVFALGAALLIQPAYGFYYAALLIPAALELWELDRTATFTAVLLAVPLAYISPALSGIVFILAASSAVIRHLPGHIRRLAPQITSVLRRQFAQAGDR